MGKFLSEIERNQVISSIIRPGARPREKVFVISLKRSNGCRTQQMEINRFLVRNVLFPGDERARIRNISQRFIRFDILSHPGTFSSFQFSRDSSLIFRDSSQFLLVTVLKGMEICHFSAPFQFWWGVLWINTSLPGDSLHLYPCCQRRKTADLRTRQVPDT
jgi:hypothetical protein